VQIKTSQLGPQKENGARQGKASTLAGTIPTVNTEKAKNGRRPDILSKKKRNQIGGKTLNQKKQSSLISCPKGLAAGRGFG